MSVHTGADNLKLCKSIKKVNLEGSKRARTGRRGDIFFQITKKSVNGVVQALLGILFL